MPDQDAPKRESQLRRLLQRPDAKPRVKRAVGSLLAVGVASIGIFGILIIWHLIRRGRLIRESLAPPKDVEMPELSDLARPAPERGPT